MLQGQEKSHSIVDSNAPFCSFSCYSLPEVRGERMFLGEIPKSSLLFLSPLPQLSGPRLPLSEHTESIAGQGVQVAMGKQSYSLYILLLSNCSVLGAPTPQMPAGLESQPAYPTQNPPKAACLFSHKAHPGRLWHERELLTVMCTHSRTAWSAYT